MNNLKLKHGSEAFPCPLCSVYAQQSWYFIKIKEAPHFSNSPSPKHEYYSLETDYDIFDPKGYQGISFSVCKVCSEESLWLNEELVYPFENTVENPSPLMPEEVKVIYDEARAVLNISPRSSAALLRLALEILLPYLGADKATINNMIQQLVDERKAISRVQKAMDSLRVIGNDAVHPGVIDLEGRDDKAVSLALFKIINFIVAETLGSDDMIEDLYSLLPERVKEGIENRKVPNKKN